MTERRPLPPGTLRVGSIAGIDVVVRYSWLLIALLLAVLVAPRVDQVAPGLGPLVYVAGLAFAVLLYLTVLLHEAAHAIAALRYGLSVRSISIHFLGGATEIEQEAPTPRAEFVIAVVGPLTSIAVGLATFGASLVLPDGLLRLAMQGLAWANLVVGVLNLVPGLPLDGGRVLRALVWAVGKDPDRATIVAAWGGRVAAVAVLAWPVTVYLLLGSLDLYNLFMAIIIATFLWGGATASLTHARLRARLPALQARPLARRLLVVPEDLPLAEAVRRAQDEAAGGIAVHDTAERITGLVDERALSAVPEDRRAWVPVRSVARTLTDDLRLSADLVGEDLVRAMSANPSPEYLLVEADGQVFGMLATSDVDAAFAAAGR